MLFFFKKCHTFLLKKEPRSCAELWGRGGGWKNRFWRAVFPRQSSFFKNVTFWIFSGPGKGDPIWESILWMFHVFLLKAWFWTNVTHFSLKKARRSMRTKKWKENELKQIFRSNKHLNIGIKTWKQTEEKEEWQSNVMLNKKKKGKKNVSI